MDVPFFACPFRFPKLVAVPEKSMEAIAEFDTDSILTGIFGEDGISKFSRDRKVAVGGQGYA